MLCEVCGGDFPHSPDGVLKYGRYYICKRCLAAQTPCTVCGKKRIHKDVFDRCEDCVEPLIPQSWIIAEEDTPPPRIKIREDRKKGICPSCGERKVLDENMDGDGLICGSCYYHSGKCTACGEKSHRLERSRYDRRLCPKCQVKESRGVEQRWNYRPDKFFKYGSGDFLLGAENEVQMGDIINKDQYLDQIAGNYPKVEVYTMYDGTIDYGTEVVFHPRTLKSYQKLKYSGMTYGIRHHNNCGMHVHISRDAFLNKMHLYKFIRFIFKNKKFITKIAERDVGTHRQRSWKFTKELDAISKVKGYDVDPDKYMDINMLHPETIELRIFQGATTKEQFLKNMEFAHALTLFSKETRPKYMTAYRFKLWLNVNGCNYPNLLNFLSKGEQ